MTNEPATITSLQNALALAARGWYVFPCHEKPWTYTDRKTGELVKCKGKEPYYDKRNLPNGKNNATTDPKQITAWWNRWPGALIGVPCAPSGFFALDVDLDESEGINGWTTLAGLIDAHGDGAPLWPVTGPIQRTPRGGNHLFFKLPQDVHIPNTASKLGTGLDLRSDGYVCTGAGYTWAPDHGPDAAITNAPAWLLELIRNLDTSTAPRMPQAARTFQNSPEAGAYWLQKALRMAVPGTRNHTGFWLACQLRDANLTQGEAESVMNDYAASVPGQGYTQREAQASRKTAYSQAPRAPAHGIGRNGRYAAAATMAPDNFSPGELPQPEGIGADLPVTTPTPGAFKCDDIGNGERLRVRHGRKMRYIKERGWLVWTGKAWEEDRGQVERWAKETARSLYAEVAACEDDAIAKAIEKHARATAYRGRREAMVAACASEPGIPARPADFDRDPWALNCENGILDLKNGELRPHDTPPMLTKIAGTYYDPEADCPRWLRFLDRIFDGNPELIDFLQRAVGYSLTGTMSEQCLFFLYGSGANGKSTFTGAVQDALGDYAQKTRAETFLKKQGDQIPEDVARLAGVRFALAAELTGGHLNESLVKDLTGGDRLAARFLHHNTFEFKPVVKLWLYGNAKPAISETTEGIWRRVRLVPFAVIIPEGERDGKLPEKLRDELPGILAWAVRGCLTWQREGLNAPATVKDATENYRQEQDEIARFVEEWCTCAPGMTATAGGLYEAYKKWGGAWSMQRFSRSMGDHGYKKGGRDGQGRALYRGIGIIDNGSQGGESWQK